jgi:hypothetical protein
MIPHYPLGHILSTEKNYTRFSLQYTKFWPGTELWRFTLPLQKIAHTHQCTPTDRMEAIQPYVVTPWEGRLPATIDLGAGETVKAANVTRQCGQ